MRSESVKRIVHRDIKASNILLDKDLNAKITLIGLALHERGLKLTSATAPAPAPALLDVAASAPRLSAAAYGKVPNIQRWQQLRSQHQCSATSVPSHTTACACRVH
ncbi:hypothetical protein GUJ93_ZPchr0014g47594 [Zizania palustris]|uniref:Protein kinase domain-containing protein n=1 Tax=Zizania palustris TaxID=103762 RepID=A0A8J5SWA9_ZIZPA|nr:hypothetical protein GUJ93_ZPchr0014g47594 [Zizania palustris]